MSKLGSNIPAASVAPPEDASEGMPETIAIVLEENDNIPPTGQYFGLNSYGYLLRAGMAARVPLGIVDILNHAVQHVAVVNPLTMQVVAWRKKLRFPYRFVRDMSAEDLRAA